MRIVERPKQSVKIHHSDPSTTREYAVSGCATRNEVATLVKATAPIIDVVDGVSHFREYITFKEFGGGNWDATAHFSKDPTSTEWTINIGAGSTKITHAECIGGYDCINGAGSVMGIDFPDFKNGIGYNGTHFDGCDVELPKMEFGILKRYQASAIPGSYVQQLFEMCQTVNASDYTLTYLEQTLEFRAGSLRFRGASIKQDSAGNLTIDYSFVYSRNTLLSDNLIIGASEPVEKLGHEWLAVYSEEITNAGRKIKRPVAVYIHKVYEESDFDTLLV